MDHVLEVTQGLSDQVENLCGKQDQAYSKAKANLKKQRDLAARIKSLEEENEGLKGTHKTLELQLEKGYASVKEGEELKHSIAWTKNSLDSALASQEEYRKSYKSMHSSLKRATLDFHTFQEEITKHNAYRKQMEALKDRYKVLNQRQKINSEKVINRMAREEDENLQAYFIQAWLHGVAECKREKKLEKEAKIAEIEAKHKQEEYERLMVQKKEVAKRTLARMNDGNTEGLLAMVVTSWCQIVQEDKSAREAERIRQEVENHLKGIEAKKKGDAKAVLERMSAASDTGLKGVCFNAWKSDWEEHAAAKALEKRAQEADAKAAEVMKSKKEEAKKMLAKMNASSDSALLEMVFRNWLTWSNTEKKERLQAEIAEAKLLEIQKKKKGEASSVVERMTLRKGKELLQSLFVGWIASMLQYQIARQAEEEWQEKIDALQKEVDKMKDELEDKLDDLDDVQEELVESQKRHKLLQEKLVHMNESHEGLLKAYDDMLTDDDD